MLGKIILEVSRGEQLSVTAQPSMQTRDTIVFNDYKVFEGNSPIAAFRVAPCGSVLPIVMFLEGKSGWKARCTVAREIDGIEQRWYRVGHRYIMLSERLSKTGMHSSLQEAEQPTTSTNSDTTSRRVQYAKGVRVPAYEDDLCFHAILPRLPYLGGPLCLPCYFVLVFSCLTKEISIGISLSVCTCYADKIPYHLQLNLRHDEIIDTVIIPFLLNGFIDICIKH